MSNPYMCEKCGKHPAGKGVALCYECSPWPKLPTPEPAGYHKSPFQPHTLLHAVDAYIATHPFALGQPFTAGRHVWAQAYYRDPPSPFTTNLSDGLHFVVCP